MSRVQEPLGGWNGSPGALAMLSDGWEWFQTGEVTDKRGTKDPQVSKGSHTRRPSAEPKSEGSGPAKVGLQLGRSGKPLTP